MGKLTRVHRDISSRNSVSLQVEIIVDLRQLATAAGQLRDLAVVDLGDGVLEIAQVVCVGGVRGDACVFEGLG
jgi:hypothetical protein